MASDVEHHTDLCEKIHELLVQASEDHHNAKSGSLTRERLSAVIDSLSQAEDAAHGACPG